MNAIISRKQAAQIRQLVDSDGWQAVRKHPELGAVLAKSLKASRQYVNGVVDR